MLQAHCLKYMGTFEARQAYAYLSAYLIFFRLRRAHPYA